MKEEDLSIKYIPEKEWKCTCPSWMKHTRNIPCISVSEIEENAPKVLEIWKEILSN